MKRLLIALTLAATPLLAQQAARTETQKPVASINGETITADQLDQLYNRLTPEMREQYSQRGGKGALLENYIRKRLLIQEAVKSGFDKRPSVRAEVEAARESALFDRYIREVVAQSIVTDAAMKHYYEQHQDQFAVPEMIKVRHVVIGITNSGPHPHTQEQAMEIAKAVVTEVLTQIPRSDNPAANAQEISALFAAIARRYSEDPSAPSGGDLGWVARGQLDPDFENVAFSLRTGVPSGIVSTRFGHHIILVEGRRPAGTESFDEAKARVRDLLLNEHQADIVAAVDKLTAQLSDKGKISVYPENIR